MGRGHVAEAAAAVFEVRVVGTGGEVSTLVLFVQIDVGIVRADQGIRGPNAVAAGFDLGGSILADVVPIGAVGALLGEVRAFLFGERELRGWENEPGFANLLDQGRPSVLDTAARKDSVSAGLGLECGA